MKFNVVLFNDFETLDVFGPVEAIGMVDKFKNNEYEIEFYSETGGLITSAQNVRVETFPLSEIKETGVLFIPGGWGVRREVNNQKLIEAIRELAVKSEYVLIVCTGSALLAKTGLLKNVRATSNKISFEWVTSQDDGVNWARKSRWVNDGKYYTSSGVSAGIDMALGFISDRLGAEAAIKISKGMEYVWNSDKDNDQFC